MLMAIYFFYYWPFPQCVQFLFILIYKGYASLQGTKAYLFQHIVLKADRE